MMQREYVFIVGCARTGTTLLRQILSKSERICIAPETHFLRRFRQTGSPRKWRWGDLADDSSLDRMVDFMYSGRQVTGSAYWGWLAATECHAYCEERYPENYTLVRFEGLVIDPERQIRRRCSFLKISFAQAMVSDVQVVGSSYQTYNRGSAGFDRTALDRWKSSLHPAVGLWFALLAREQLEKFGYA